MSVKSSMRLEYNFTDMYQSQIIQNTKVRVQDDLELMGEENCSDFLFLYGKIHGFLYVKKGGCDVTKFHKV